MELKDTIIKIRVDIRDVQGFIDAIDQHIKRLAKDQQVVTPELVAAQNVLKRVDAELQSLEQ